MQSLRRAYGALKDSTKVGLAKVNSEFKDLDIAIVKATNHVESPPKGRHLRKIFLATSSSRPRADVAYCIHALSRRLAKTRSWIVAVKTLIVIHRTLREGDPTFREELLNYLRGQHMFQISNFKDNSTKLARICSAWVRTYALFLQERLKCFRTLKYDIESEQMIKILTDEAKMHHRTRILSMEELFVHLPALQRLLYSLINCQPEGAACHNSLIQYALALVLKESFKIYCAINEGIINLVDMFFDMSKDDAVYTLDIYRKAGQQAESLANFYDLCRGLDLARTFHFPTLRQPPFSLIADMEEYIREAPQTSSVSNRRLDYREIEQEPQKPEGPTPEKSEKQVKEPPRTKEEQVDMQKEVERKKKDEVPPLISTQGPTDLLGLNEVQPIAQELGESNALTFAISQPGNDPPNSYQLAELGKTSGWELALVAASSNTNNSQAAERNLAGGFDMLLLDSLYEDEAARRHLQLQNAGHQTPSGYEMSAVNPFDQWYPFAVSNDMAPPPNVHMALMAQQQQQQQMMLQHHIMLQQEQMILQQQERHNMMMITHQYPGQNSQPQMPYTAYSNPFGDPFAHPQTSSPSVGNQTLL